MTKYTNEGSRSAKMRNQYADGGTVTDAMRQKGHKQIKFIDSLAAPSVHRYMQEKQALAISDAVPRRKEND